MRARGFARSPAEVLHAPPERPPPNHRFFRMLRGDTLAARSSGHLGARVTIALGCVVSAAVAPRCRKGWSESAQPAQRSSSAHKKAADPARTTQLLCSSTVALPSVVVVRESEAATFMHGTIPPQPTEVTKDEPPSSNRSRRADQDLGQLVTRTLSVTASALRCAASKIDANMLPPLRHDFEVCQLRMARKSYAA